VAIADDRLAPLQDALRDLGIDLKAAQPSGSIAID
jgi:hypothetical protein